MLNNSIRKWLRFITIVVLISQYLLTSILIFAQETTDPTPTVTSSPAPTSTPDESSPTPNVPISPDPSPTLEATPQPTQELSPTTETSPTQTQVSPIVQSETPPQSEPTPVMQSTPASVPTLASFPEWIAQSDGGFATHSILLNKEYTAPFNSNFKITFTTLPQDSRAITVHHLPVSFNISAGTQMGEAYEITSDMTNGTFQYDLTLPLPTNLTPDKTIISYSEDGKTFQTVVNPKTFDQHAITIKNLNHFTIFAISADTNGTNGTGVYTSIAGPTLVESAVGQITSDLTLNIPSGFEFNTTANSVTASVTNAGACSGGGNKPIKLGTGAGSSSQTVTPTSSQVKIKLKQSSSGIAGCAGTITWSGIQVRPTVGTPLSNGNITLTGTIGGATFNTDTLKETPGAISISLSTVSANPISIPADNSTTSTITTTLKDTFGNPVPNKNLALSSSRGATDTISSASGPSNNSGIVTFTVKSATLGTATFTASDAAHAITITQTADVLFTDTTPPSTPGTPTTTTPTNNNKPTWTWTDATDNVGIHHYIFYWGQTAGSETNNSGSLTPATTNFTHTIALTDTTWFGKVKAFDAAGNLSVSNNGSVVIDTTVPTGSMIINNNAVYTNSNNVTLNFSNVSSDVTIMQLANGPAGSFQSPISYENPHAYTLPNNGDGTYTVRARFADSANNKSSVTSDTIIVDTTAPTLSADNSSSSWKTSNVTITLSATDTGSGLQNVRYNWDSAASATDGTVFTNGTTVTIPSEGNHILYLYADDNAGNTTSFFGTYKLDTSVPAVSATGTSLNWQNTLPVITVSATDSVSGIASLKYAWDVDAATGTSVTSGTDISSTFPGDGTHTLHLFSTDNSGLTNTFSADYKIDRTIPNVPGIPSTTTPTVATAQVWNWSNATDSTSGIAAYDWRIVGGSSGATTSGPLTTNLTEGTWTLYVKAEDNAGNQSGEASSSITVLTSTSLPTSVSPSSLTVLIGGVLTIPDGATASSTPSVTVGAPVIINVPTTDGISSITLPAGTIITKTDGSNMNANDLTAANISATSLTGLSSNTVVNGALQWGLPNIGLTFSTPITLHIFVGSAFEGQTLTVLRSTNGTTDWTNDAIVSPATCLVTSGICSFQATQASVYAVATVAPATTTPPSSTTSSNSGGSNANNTPAAPSCNDSPAGGSPTLLSAVVSGQNQVTLTWSKAADPVTHYIVVYGLTANTPLYGNPNIGDKNTTTYTVSGLAGKTTYYFKIRAGNGCNAGAYSNELSTTPGGVTLAGAANGFATNVLGTSTTKDAIKSGKTKTKSDEVKGESTMHTKPSPTSEPTTQVNNASFFSSQTALLIFLVLCIILTFSVFKFFRKKYPPNT